MPHKRLPQRVIALQFPHLPTDRIFRHRWGKSWRLKERPETPALVVYDTIQNALRVTAHEKSHHLSGIHIGQSLSDARAINPQIECVEHNRTADRDLLCSIARWCERYTPLVALSGEDGLFLDVTGCAHLFKGEVALLEDIEKRLVSQGFEVKLACADTPGAAWALCRYGKTRVASSLSQRELIEPLPLTGLRLSQTDIQGLSKLGFRTIGCLYTVPRAPLAARFGTDVLLRLDQALGDIDEVLSPLRPVAELVSEKRFADPIVDEDDIKRTIMLLCENAIPALERRGLGMQACELTLFRANGDVETIVTEASAPLRNAKRMAALFDERLASLHDNWEAGFGFDILRLAIIRSAPLQDTQQALIATAQASDSDDANHLIDRLSARLGKERVRVFAHCDTHIPERRFALQPALTATQKEKLSFRETQSEVITRPLILFPRPERVEAIAEVPEGPPLKFRWRKVSYDVVRAEGPERIACEWWKDDRAAHTRDYFRIEDREGYRLWVFRHGLYERETHSPNWYVHGMFG